MRYGAFRRVSCSNLARKRLAYEGAILVPIAGQYFLIADSAKTISCAGVTLTIQFMIIHIFILPSTQLPPLLKTTTTDENGCDAKIPNDYPFLIPLHLLTPILLLIYLTSLSRTTKRNFSQEALPFALIHDKSTGLKLMQTSTNSPDVYALQNFFSDDTFSDEPNPFHPKSLWTPPTNRDDALNAFLNAVKHDLLTS